MAYVSGTITALNGTVSPSASAEGTFSLAIQNVSGNTLVVEASLDNSNWYAIPISAITVSGLGALQGTITADGFYSVQQVDLYFVRVRASAYTSGTIAVTMYGNQSVCGQAVTNVSIVGGSSGLEAATYSLVSASGSTTVKNGSGTLYAVYNLTATALLSTLTVKDGSTTILPSNAPLNASPYNITFGPGGAKFTTSLIVTLGGLLSTPVLVLYS